MNRRLASRWPAAALFAGAGLCLSVLVPARDVAPVTPADDSDPAKAIQLEPFVVTGSLIKRMDFEGPSPIQVISRQEIEQVAGTGLADVLRDIPAATNLGINESTTTTPTRGATALDLRSLGPENTLILVDGRRQAPNGIASDRITFVDLDRFPTAMIERIEVLKDGAAAVYGADATAGVVNIILRKDYTGAEISGRYGNYFRTDAAEQSWSLLAGGRRGRVRAMIGLTYSSRDPIAATDLPFSADADKTEIWRAIDPVKYAAQLQPTPMGTSFFDLRSSSGPYATVSVPKPAQLTNPSNGLTIEAIRNPLTGMISVFLPGTGGVPEGTLGSSGNAASVPRENNPGVPTAAQFVPRAYPAGPFSNSFNSQPFVWITPETERRGVTANFGFDLTDTIDFFAAVGFVRLKSLTQLAPPPIATKNDNDILVPATNYYNPFGIPVAFAFRSLDVGPRIVNVTSDSISALAGLNGTLDHRFDWELGWSYSSNQNSDTETDLRESKVRAALAKTTPDALNIFGGPAFHNDPATIESLKTNTTRSGDASTALADFHITTSDLFALPWGSVGASASLEHRLERFNVTNDEQSSVLNDIIGDGGPADGPTHSRRDVQSVAAELRLPLVPEGRWPWLRTVELSGAARFERFSDGYNSGVKPFVGLRLRLTNSLLLRASYGEVFRAPSLPQLFGGVVDSYGSGLADLRRPVELTGDPEDSMVAQRLFRTGGNPHLQPENGTTRQVGMVFDAPWRPLKGLSLEATHGIISQDEVISNALDLDFIQNNELGTTADLIVRESGTETYVNTTPNPIPVLSGPNGATTPILPGQRATVPGRITMIINSAVNLSNQTVRYYDYGLRYRRPTERFGNFTLSSDWTYYEYYAFQYLPADVPLSKVGHELPRFRGQSSLSWERSRWSAYVNMNYIHHHVGGDPDDGEWEIRSYYTFSTGLNYAFAPSSMLRGMRLSVGVENLFNRDPSPDVNASGYEQGFVGRPAGRFCFVGFRQVLRATAIVAGIRANPVVVAVSPLQLSAPSSAGAR